MAVTALPSARARAPHQSATLPPGVLLLTLVAPALDLLRSVQPATALGMVGLLATAVASTALLVAWTRFPRTSWLLAAGLASAASLALRVAGADVGPALSLLSVVALGIGGAFASRPGEADVGLV